MGLFDKLRGKSEKKTEARLPGKDAFLRRLKEDSGFMQKAEALFQPNGTLGEAINGIRALGYSVDIDEALEAMQAATDYYREKEREDAAARARETVEDIPELADAKLREPKNEAEKFFFEMIGNDTLREQFQSRLTPSVQMGELVEYVKTLGYEVDVIDFVVTLKRLSFKLHNNALRTFFLDK